MIDVKMYKAGYGDAFLIRLRGKVSFNILIDMGLKTTYRNEIKKDLLQLAKQGEKIDLLVVSHIDNDHINGVVEFIKENGKEHKIIYVDEVWHNSYRHLQFSNKKFDSISQQERSVLKEIKNQNINVFIEDGVSDIGYQEGVSLASLLYNYNYNWNNKFNGEAVCIENNFNNLIKVGNCILLSPDKRKLTKLAEKWKDKLDEIIYDFNLSDDRLFDDAYEFYMQNLKESNFIESSISYVKDNYNLEELSKKEEKEIDPKNGSSISFILEFEGKKMLFLGDAHEDLIFERLSLLKKEGYSLDFKLVKLSHHGSNRNISNRLIDLIDSEYFLISTNGKRHSHPNIEALSKIIMKKTDFVKKLIFNYEHSKLKWLENEKIENKFSYKIIYSNNITI